MDTLLSSGSVKGGTPGNNVWIKIAGILYKANLFLYDNMRGESIDNWIVD